jgi:chromosome segregation ATPase
MKKTKTQNYYDAVEAFLERKRKAAQEADDNRIQRREFEQQYRHAVIDDDETRAIELQKAIEELDKRHRFLALQQSAYSQNSMAEKLEPLRQAAVLEQQKALDGLRDDFSTFRERIEALRHQWHIITREAHEARRNSQRAQANLSELIGNGVHHAGADSGINTETLRGFIFMDNKEIRDLFLGRK